MKRLGNRGFTLIELLVVIAIIGLLSSIVLASLNSARSKGADASVKAGMANARAQAELFYDSVTPNSYAGVCATGGSAIGAILAGAVVNSADANGVVDIVNTTAASATVAVCHAISTAWMAQMPLRGGGSWCVDSTGFSGPRTQYVLASIYVCPAS